MTPLPENSTKLRRQLCWRRVSRMEEQGANGAVALAEAEGDCDRTRLISDIARLVRNPCMPETMRHAGLTLIGWLARREAKEAPHAVGVEEALEAERQMYPARLKSR
jgi:hypothetical protein